MGLTSIAQLKANQIAAWRAERLDEGAALMARPRLTERLLQWLSDPQASEREGLLSEFQVLQKFDGYSDVMLVDADGRVRLSLSSDTEMLPDEAMQALHATLRDGRPTLTDLHADLHNSTPHISVIAPLIPEDETGERPRAALILVNDARQFLFPLIQSWPTTSETAETLLIRR